MGDFNLEGPAAKVKVDKILCLLNIAHLMNMMISLLWPKITTRIKSDWYNSHCHLKFPPNLLRNIQIWG